MRGEPVEAVEDVGRVEDRGRAGFALFDEEGKEAGTDEDVKIDSYLGR